MNIGIIEGGRATNMIADFAKAQLLYRLVAPSQALRERLSLPLASVRRSISCSIFPICDSARFPGFQP